MSNAITIKPAQAASILKTNFEGNLPALLMGAPGIGKSDVVAQAAAAIGAELMISHPAVADPTDFRGLPWPDATNGQAHFLPFGDFARALRADKPLVWFLDDLGQAPASVQAATMQLILARRVNGHRLPEQVIFVAATNRRTDRSGVNGLFNSLVSRFSPVIEMVPDLDDWVAWAYKNGMPDSLIAFLRFRPDLLLQYDPKQASADMAPFACPRTWMRVGKMLKLPYAPDVRFPALAGTVGEGPAGELMAFLSVRENMPDLDQIISDPHKAEIPKANEIAVLYAVSVGLASRAHASNFASIGIYLERMHRAGFSEFSALCLRDAYRRDASIGTLPEFAEMVNSPLGKMLMGH